jgi:hypothetical protein
VVKILHEGSQIVPEGIEFIILFKVQLNHTVNGSFMEYYFIHEKGGFFSCVSKNLYQCREKMKAWARLMYEEERYRNG